VKLVTETEFLAMIGIETVKPPLDGFTGTLF
jgi:hypothetical protein